MRFSNARLADDHFGLEIAAGGPAVSRIFFGVLCSEFKLMSWREVHEPAIFLLHKARSTLGLKIPAFSW